MEAKNNREIIRLLLALANAEIYLLPLNNAFKLSQDQV